MLLFLIEVYLKRPGSVISIDFCDVKTSVVYDKIVEKVRVNYSFKL